MAWMTLASLGATLVGLAVLNYAVGTMPLLGTLFAAGGIFFTVLLAAALMGVSLPTMHAITFAMSGLLAGLGGAIAAITYGSIAYAGGLIVGLKALMAAIIAGSGSVGGAALCGFGLALVEALWSALLPIEHRDAMVFVVLAAFAAGCVLGVLAMVPGRWRRQALAAKVQTPGQDPAVNALVAASVPADRAPSAPPRDGL
jgi:predicted ABC-type sugar transport system permease subunit